MKDAFKREEPTRSQMRRKTLITEEAEPQKEVPVEQPEMPVEAPKEQGEYFPAFTAAELTVGLQGIGEDHSFEARAKIAKANGMPNYYSAPDQNNKMLMLAREGKLKRG